MPTNLSTRQPRVLICGDSIFDNTPYVGTHGTDLRTHLLGLTEGWDIAFKALDGAKCDDVSKRQLKDARDYDAIIISIGGNNALEHVHHLGDPNGRTFLGTALLLSEIQNDFRREYRAVMERARSVADRMLTCTIYRPRYHLDGYPREMTGAIEPLLSVFNDVIQEEARNAGAALLDLRAICTSDADFENAGNKRGHSSAGTPGIKRGQSC